nr:MAG TPA: portal protein [Caudoviricetes sp.]
MTGQSLGNITEHPKIAVTQEEYNRISRNLTYYQSKWPEIEYLNSNHEKKKRSMNHLPIARTASKKIASLVFNEQAEITVKDEETNKFIQKTLKNDRFNKNFERYLESCLALGGLAMRPYVSGDSVKVSFVQAPVFLPLQSNTQDISSAAIVTKTIKAIDKKNVYYTLIEFHEWDKDGKYVITNELYRSSEKEKVGDRVPLAEVYEDLEEEVVLEQLTRPLFTYLKPPGMNNKDVNSPLGLSIFDNAKSTIDFINTTYDEFRWEVKMGQRRVIVPDQTVRIGYARNGDVDLVKREFDPEQNVYEQIDGGKDTPVNITDLTTPIRSDDYIKAINEGLALFEMQIGVSAGMFSFDGKSMKTATEIVSENSDTYQMRNSIVSLVEQAIKELIVSICELGSMYDLYSGQIPTLEDITISLDDGVFTDKNNELDYWTKALASGIVSKSYAIQKTLNMSETDAQKMIKSINEEAISEANSVRNQEDVDIYGE